MEPRVFVVFYASGRGTVRSIETMPARNEAEVLEKAKLLKPMEDEEIVKIFSIGMSGKVQEHQIVFRGRLKLEPVPEKVRGE